MYSIVSARLVCASASKDVDGNQGMRNEVISDISELDKHINDNEKRADDTCYRSPFPRQDPCGSQAGNEEIKRRRQLPDISDISRRTFVCVDRNGTISPSAHRNAIVSHRWSALFQIVTDEVGSNKTHLQEEQEYLDLRCEGISARCTEVPGKEESNRKWNERCDCPPAFPVAQTFSFFHFFHRFFVRFFYFIYFFLYFICRFLSRKIFFPAEAFPAFIFLRVMITLYIPVTISLLIKK